MSYYWWSTVEDDHDPVWIMSKPTEGGPALYDRYKVFVCKECRKIEHRRAVMEAGLDGTLEIDDTRDFFQSTEGITCVSARFLTVLAELHLSGFQAMKVPASPHFSLLWPSTFAHVEVLRSTVQLHAPICPVCSQYDSVGMNPRSNLGIVFPTDTLEICGLDIQPMNKHFRAYDFYSHETVVEYLSSHASVTTGLRFVKTDTVPAIQLAGGDWRKRHRPINRK